MVVVCSWLFNDNDRKLHSVPRALRCWYSDILNGIGARLSCAYGKSLNDSVLADAFHSSGTLQRVVRIKLDLQVKRLKLFNGLTIFVWKFGRIVGDLESARVARVSWNVTWKDEETCWIDYRTESFAHAPHRRIRISNWKLFFAFYFKVICEINTRNRLWISTSRPDLHGAASCRW